MTGNYNTRRRDYTPRDQVITNWISKYCVDPQSGGPVILTPEECAALARCYVGLHPFNPVSLMGRLAAFAALALIVGPEAQLGKTWSSPSVNLDQIWNAALPGLRMSLIRTDDEIICRNLGTHVRVAA